MLLTSTRAADGPAFRSAASAFLKSGLTSKGALTRPLARALGSYEGRPGPLPFDNVSAGYYRGFQDLKSIPTTGSATRKASGCPAFERIKKFPESLNVWKSEGSTPLKATLCVSFHVRVNSTNRFRSPWVWAGND